MTVTATTEVVRSADGTPIAVERRGEGPSLVVVDGATCHRELNSARPLADALADRFTVHLFDRRGRGESGDTPPYSVDREVDDVRAVVAATGADEPFVFGISSGALLTVQAVAAGVPVAKVALFEPPLGEDADGTTPSAYTVEITALVRAGRNTDAVETFLTGIGVPPPMVAGMKDSPMWPQMAAIAPTIVYDLTICDATTVDTVRRVPVPTLVLDSEGSTGDLTGWAATVVGALPNGSHRSLPGQWHQVPDDLMAAALAGFFLDDDEQEMT